MPSILDFGRFFFHAALGEKVKSTVSIVTPSRCCPSAELAVCRSTARATVATRDQPNMRAREDLGFIMGWFAKPLPQPSFHVLIGAPKRKRFAGLEPTIWHHDSRADR
jgi:hypothetical protein